jgi:tyrosine-protein kinase Etk/Wzc
MLFRIHKMAGDGMNNSQHPKEREFWGASGVLGLLMTLAKWKKFIFAFTLLATLLAVIMSFILPKWYRSSATLLPPKSSSVLGGLGGVSALLKDFTPISSKVGGQSAAYNYLSILESRKAEESVINRFGLMQEYGIQNNSMEDAMKELENNYAVELNDGGSLLISMEDKDSVRAAEMVNFMVQTLNSISIELGTTEARSNRMFLEKRVLENKDSLHQAELQLKSFQESHGIMILPEETKSLIGGLGDLYARKTRLDIEIALLKKTVGEENPAYIQARMEAGEIDKKLGTYPAIGMESFRLYRDLVIQQKILELLVPLYEQARIEEQKDMPVMVVLDKAVPAEKKSRPHRALITLSTFFSALLVSIIIALTSDRFREYKLTHSTEFEALISYLRFHRRQD